MSEAHDFFAGIFDTDKAHLATQIGVARALTVVLQEAHRRELPPIQWTISDVGSSIAGRVSRPGADNAAREATFDGYAELVEHFHNVSVELYGPGTLPHLTTETRRWRHDTPGGYVCVGAKATHVDILLAKPTGRGRVYDRRVWLTALTVVADLNPADDPDTEGDH